MVIQKHLKVFCWLCWVISCSLFCVYILMMKQCVKVFSKDFLFFLQVGVGETTCWSRRAIGVVPVDFFTDVFKQNYGKLMILSFYKCFCFVLLIGFVS